MTVILAESAGFCVGVARAVDITEKALAESPDCWSLGELIHNRDVVERLNSRGLSVASCVEEVPDSSRVVIRSHGVPRSECDALLAKNCTILDATCPRVSRIHKIVQRADEEGRQVVIFGEPSHPEVQGICGWCHDPVVVPDCESFQQWAKENKLSADAPLTVVFQTTSNKKTSEQTFNSLKKVYTKAKFFDTICDATSIRQAEARTLSASCDAMVVVGGLHSANSIHLAEICREECDTVLFVQNAAELDPSMLSGKDRVGITAGASTPSWIIKEVVNKMNEPEILKEEIVEEAAPVAEEAAVVEEAPAEKGEMSFDELLEESIKTIYNGDTVTGVVAAIGTTEITLDLPTKHSGYISVSEFTDDKPGVNINDLVKIGDEIQASVIRVNDVEGTVQLSKRRLDAAKSWEDIEASAEEGTVLEGKVSEENKGGVVINLKGIRVFIPASQTGLGRDVPMTELVGQTVRFKITEVNRGRKRVVGSIRQVASRERREKAEKIWAEIEVGKKYNGVVKSMTSYGAFVDIGGVDGMVHVSEISWNRIRKPDDVLSVGDEIEVYVINFDPEKKKISLGYRKAEDNPWTKFTETYKVGDVANVKIVKFMTFGAFAEILPGVDGLIHISQIANRRIGKPEEELTVGQQVDAKITAIDNEKQKVSLSIRALLEPAPAPEREREERPERRKPEPEGDALVYEISADGQATGFAPEEDEIVEE
ncbi:MAG: bifunctional 4-hydroxy-3-methylbut-2-enyl diphosphate reductase/30S ribosomal protein S1 [Oscillospiraceae bacterium]